MKSRLSSDLVQQAILPLWHRHSCLCWLSTTILLISITSCFAADNKISAGNGMLYCGGRPQHIFLIHQTAEKKTCHTKCPTAPPGPLSPPQATKPFYIEKISH